MYKKLTYLAVLIIATTSAFAEDIPTRFGALKINDENMLLYKGHPLSPEIRGNSSLSILGNYQLGASDILLIQDNGGSACPALFYFVAISASGVKATPAFGTCSDLVKVKQKGDVVSVIMPGYQGPFSPKADHVKAAKQKHVFLYKGGLLTENGKPVE